MTADKQERVRAYMLKFSTASKSAVAKATGASLGTVAHVRAELVREGLRPAARNQKKPVAPVVSEDAPEGSNDKDVDVLGALEARLTRALTAAAVPADAVPELIAAMSQFVEQLVIETSRELAEFE